jgi:chromate transporter
MAPLTLALLLSAGWILTANTPGWRHVLLTAATAVVVWRTRVHLLVLIAAGSLLGALRLL